MATKRKLPKGIDQLPSGRYRARYTDANHQQQTAPTTFTSVTAAKHWLDVTGAERLSPAVD